MKIKDINGHEMEMENIDIYTETALKKQGVYNGGYPFIVRNPISAMCELTNKSFDRKLTIEDLTKMWDRRRLDGDIDGDVDPKLIYGDNERKWRHQREFFQFVSSYEEAERSAVVNAAISVIEAMRLAGEDEEKIRWYKTIFVGPVLRKHR